MKKIISIVLISFVFTSCFKEIDPEPRYFPIEETFTVQKSIQKTQTYYYLYENAGMEVGTASPRSWDLAFESAGNSSKVLLGWATGSLAHKTGKYNIADVSQDEVLDFMENSDEWTFDDPAYTNYPDSLSLQYWEDGEVYIQNRGVESDNYYLIQFVEKTDDTYTFKYAKATDNQNTQTYIINRSDGLNYIYFSYEKNSTVIVDPRTIDWDLVFTPYLGWWETLDGNYSPYSFNGILINNEGGVRVAQIFNEDIAFEDIDSTYIATSEFIDWKGAIGSNWKILAPVGTVPPYIMDQNKKYILKKYDSEAGIFKHFKLQIINYRLDGEDHHPTIEFKYLPEE